LSFLVKAQHDDWLADKELNMARNRDQDFDITTDSTKWWTLAAASMPHGARSRWLGNSSETAARPSGSTTTSTQRAVRTAPAFYA
jgi:hypothetical protein